jgi:hypothetical protein
VFTVVGYTRSLTASPVDHQLQQNVLNEEAALRGWTILQFMQDDGDAGGLATAAEHVRGGAANALIAGEMDPAFELAVAAEQERGEFLFGYLDNNP